MAHLENYFLFGVRTLLQGKLNFNLVQLRLGVTYLSCLIWES